MPREDGPEVLVGKVAVPKTVQKPPLPRRDAPVAPVGLLSVSKTGQKTPSPRRDASGAPVGLLSVPKTGQKNALARDNLYPDGPALFPCAREHTPLGVFRCPLPSIFMKFTWHANPHYRYL